MFVETVVKIDRRAHYGVVIDTYDSNGTGLVGIMNENLALEPMDE